jgi:hypothetical protein
MALKMSNSAALCALEKGSREPFELHPAPETFITPLQVANSRSIGKGALK